MRALIDSGVWFRRYHRLPWSVALETFLSNEVTEFCLSPVSILEITFKWRHGRLPCPSPEQWLDDALEHYRLLPVTMAIARQAGLWDWPHGDPADRLITATAGAHELMLIHTDVTLRRLTGFSQRYFRGTH